MSCNRSETKPAVHKSGTPGLIAFLAVIICMAGRISAAGAAAPGAQFEIDLKELDKLKTAPKQEPARPRKEAAARAAEKRTEAPRPLKGNVTYTVKPGDNLFKILMRDFGMSNREAELRIPELLRINGLSGSTRLTVGSKLVIPAERQARDHHHRQPRHEETRAPKPETPAAEATPAEPAPPVAAPVLQEPSSTVPAHVAVKSITGAVPYQALDQLLAALSLQWERDKVIEGTIAPQNPESFSIKVDYYLEHDARRYVLVGSRKDPYEYTMLRLLEMAGYTIIRLDDQSGLPGLAKQLLTQLGFQFSSGKHRFSMPDNPAEARTLDGFLVTLKTPDTKVFITDTPLDAMLTEKLEASTVEPYRDNATATTP